MILSVTLYKGLIDARVAAVESLAAPDVTVFALFLIFLKIDAIKLPLYNSETKQSSGANHYNILSLVSHVLRIRF